LKAPIILPSLAAGVQCDSWGERSPRQSSSERIGVSPSLDGAELEDPAVYAVGTTIRNKYRILAKVGKGGMGHVYKALHLLFNEVRALKVMDPALTEREDFVRRFLREAFVARRLQHPNAVRVDDVDQTEDGRHLIVMEFIDGRMLRDVLQREGCEKPAAITSGTETK